jgi:catechol 2,3-dioxygenase-like lactoylglutathione lyase family enzyme
VRLLVSEQDAASKFYSALGIRLPNADCVWCEIPPDHRFSYRGEQVTLIKDDGDSPTNRLDEVVFAVSDIKSLQRYLVASGVPVASSSPTLDYFNVRDPEHHRIGFMQIARTKAKTAAKRPRIIHAGFVVRDRVAMEHFYRDILGFKPYWHGGMKDDQTDWESFQVPDGTDWVEFMVNVPENADQRLRGVMNHIALGVPDIHAAQKQLLTNGMKLTEEPKIGRDGKWQLNLYDPDQTRVELMEFTPVERPCCSEYTGPHPKP